MATSFNITGRHLEVTPALEAYIKNKLSKTEKMFNKITSIHVIVSVEKIQHTAEAEIRVAGDKNSIFASATSKDLYESIDDLEHKVMTQVKKYHDKLKERD